MAGFSTRTKTIWLFIIVLMVAAGGFIYLEQQENRLGILRVDAGPRYTETHFLMTQLAEVVARNSDEIRLEVVEVKSDAQTNLDMDANNIDLTTIQSHTPTIPNTELVAVLYEEIFQLITRSDTGIYQVGDLDGKRLALPPHGSSELEFFWTIGDHYDLFVQNVEWSSMSELDAADALLNKRVDAIFFVGSARNYATLKLIEDFELRRNAPNLKMLPIDQAPAMRVKRPYIETFYLEKGTFDGDPPLPDRRLTTGAVRRSLVAASSANEDHIAELTRVLFENRSDILVRFPLANRITMPDISSGLTLPLHPGAERYYSRNEPSFIQENAEPLALLVTVFAMLTSGLLALRSRFSATQKNIADQYNYDVLAIGKRVSDAQTPDELNACRRELQELLNTTVKALDVDEVSDAGFQSFAFLWRTVERDLEEKMTCIKSEVKPKTSTSRRKQPATKRS